MSFIKGFGLLWTIQKEQNNGQLSRDEVIASPDEVVISRKQKTRGPLKQRAPGSGADSQIRTGDLILTKELGGLILQQIAESCPTFGVKRGR